MAMADCKRCVFGQNEDDCWPHIAEDRECISFRLRTNADRIREMTDDELAEWLSMYDAECDTPEWWLRWLQSEANEVID